MVRLLPRWREAFSHLRADYTHEQLVVISNHAGGDIYENPYTLFRKGELGVTGYPNVFVDVKFKCAGSYANWQQNYNWAARG